MALYSTRRFFAYLLVIFIAVIALGTVARWLLGFPDNDPYFDQMLLDALLGIGVMLTLLALYWPIYFWRAVRRHRQELQASK